MAERVSMAVQFRVGLKVLQVSVPMSMGRVCPLCGSGSVSMVVRMGV